MGAVNKEHLTCWAVFLPPTGYTDPWQNPKKLLATDGLVCIAKYCSPAVVCEISKTKKQEDVLTTNISRIFNVGKFRESTKSEKYM